MALDDTMCKKSSPHIPGASMGRDPMSPAFHVNLCYGLRFVQASILVTSKPEAGAARALPVRFDFAPPAKKPRQNKPKKSDTETSGQPEHRVLSDASSGSPAKETLPSNPADAESAKQKQAWEAKLEAYQKEKKERRLPLAGLHAIRSVRESLNQRPETRHRTLIVTGDGSYTTRDVVRNLPERTTYIGRIRKDAKLHFPLAAAADKPVGRPRWYGAPAPTPEQILRDQSMTSSRPMASRSSGRLTGLETAPSIPSATARAWQAGSLVIPRTGV